MFACDELHFATGAQAMIHKPLCITIGNADDHEESIKQLNMCEDSILDIYEQHTKDGVTRDELKALMAAETWFDGEKLAEFFNVEVEERAAVAACTSDFFDRYANTPQQVGETGRTGTDDIVDAVIAEMQNRENRRIEAEKQEILADLDLYGI